MASVLKAEEVGEVLSRDGRLPARGVLASGPAERPQLGKAGGRSGFPGKQLLHIPTLVHLSYAILSC